MRHDYGIACRSHPQKGPNAAVTHATNPDASGYEVDSSVVMRASGTDQMNSRENPTSAKNGPPGAVDSGQRVVDEC